MKRLRSVLCVECAEKIGEIQNITELNESGQKFRKCSLCGRRGALSEYEHWPKTKKTAAEEIMEIACKLCHFPFVAESQEELDEHCDSCPMAEYLRGKGAEL